MKKSLRVCCTLLVCLVLFCPPVSALEMDFKDAGGRRVTITKVPSRVVSLVPAVTEIIFKLGAGEAVKGITSHSSGLENAAGKKIVGGFFNPSPAAVSALRPDLVFVSSVHDRIVSRLSSEKAEIIEADLSSVSQSFDTILLLGGIFGQKQTARQIVDDIKADLALVNDKIRRMAPDRRKRVMRLMGGGADVVIVMTPGDDSFQNEMIRLAGGIPPELGKSGNIVPMTKAEWRRFNPQVVYGCGSNHETREKLSKMDGWRAVDAVKNNQYYSFPCDLTCRAATHTGFFVKWLASTVYKDFFASKKARLTEDAVIESTAVEVDLDYVKSARIAESRVHDFRHKTLVVDFNEPLTVVSTLEGEKPAVTTAGNHYFPPPSWPLCHGNGLDFLRKTVLNTLDRKHENTALLFTGADMANLSVKAERFRDLTVYALVTAGVESNAMRSGRDKGLFYEPGTINIMVMANAALGKRAMTRSIITATEAKTAALLDLDIRSRPAGGAWRATGTGTDNVIVVGGAGRKFDNAGGHTRLGEVTATAVYKAVKSAVRKQNGLTADRHVFKRLEERGISIYSLLKDGDRRECDCGRTKGELVTAVEEVLLDRRYAGFVQTAFAVSDDYEKGLIKDLTAFKRLSRHTAQMISGRDPGRLDNFIHDPDVPEVLRIALNALCSGVYDREADPR